MRAKKRGAITNTRPRSVARLPPSRAFQADGAGGTLERACSGARHPPSGSLGADGEPSLTSRGYHSRGRTGHEAPLEDGSRDTLLPSGCCNGDAGADEVHGGVQENRRRLPPSRFRSRDHSST